MFQAVLLSIRRECFGENKKTSIENKVKMIIHPLEVLTSANESFQCTREIVPIHKIKRFLPSRGIYCLTL